MLGLGFGLLHWFAEGSTAAAASIGTAARVLSETGWINNMPLERLGLRMRRHGNWMSAGATATPETLMTPGLTGGRYLPLRPAAALVITLEGNFLEVTPDDRVAVANLLADALRGLLEVRFADAPGVIIRGLASPVQFTPMTDRPFLMSTRAAAMTATITITCVDSARYARHARLLALSTTPTPVSLGSLASGGDIGILGPLAGDLDIDLLAPGGHRIYRHALRDIDIVTDGYLQLRLDAPHALLHYDAAGTATSVNDWRSVTESSRWWKPTPYFADPSRDVWPLLRLSAGTGVYRYHEAWEH